MTSCFDETSPTLMAGCPCLPYMTGSLWGEKCQIASFKLQDVYWDLGGIYIYNLARAGTIAENEIPMAVSRVRVM